jgi:hypothetical protein
MRTPPAGITINVTAGRQAARPQHNFDAPERPLSNCMTNYAADIKPLFRERDRGSMLTHFDLWSYNEAVENKHAILARLDARTMPYDGPGPRRKSSLFGSWTSEGPPP